MKLCTLEQVMKNFICEFHKPVTLLLRGFVVLASYVLMYG